MGNFKKIKTAIYLLGILLTVAFVSKNLYFILKYIPQNTISKNVKLTTLQNFIVSKDDSSKYSGIANNHNKDYDIKKVDIPIGRKDPFVPLINASKDNSSTIVLKFTELELKPTLISYYNKNGKYPVSDVDSTLVDLDALKDALNIKDESLRTYNYKIKSYTPLTITVIGKDGQSVDLEKFTLSKFSYVYVEQGNIPSVALKYNGQIISLNVGEEYHNIKVCEANANSKYILLQDTITGSTAKISK